MRCLAAHKTNWPDHSIPDIHPQMAPRINFTAMNFATNPLDAWSIMMDQIAQSVIDANAFKGNFPSKLTPSVRQFTQCLEIMADWLQAHYGAVWMNVDMPSSFITHELSVVQFALNLNAKRLKSDEMLLARAGEVRLEKPFANFLFQRAAYFTGIITRKDIDPVIGMSCRGRGYIEVDDELPAGEGAAPQRSGAVVNSYPIYMDWEYA